MNKHNYLVLISILIIGGIFFGLASSGRFASQDQNGLTQSVDSFSAAAGGNRFKNNNLSSAQVDGGLVIDQTGALIGSGSSLIGLWKFDDGSGTSASDSSGNGMTAQVQNGAAWAGGHNGGALSFDGVNDSVAIPYGGGINLSTSPHTFAMWVNVPAGTESAYQHLFGDITGSSQRLSLVKWNSTWTISIQSAGASTNSEFPVQSGWAFVTIVMNGSSAKLYVNGVAGTSAQSVKNYTSYTLAGNLKIGYAGAANFFSGSVDDVRIYNRALTATEISQLYTDNSVPVISGGSPTGVLAAGTASATLRVTTNEASTCRYGTSNAAYSSLPASFTISDGLTHSSSISGLANGSSYAYFVRCQDAVGNQNTSSYSVSFSVANQSDTTAPVISGGSPTGAQPAGTASATLRVTTNENATCRFGNSNAAYASLASAFGTTGGTSHSSNLTGLTNGSSYNYYVRCQDTAGNANLSSYTVSFSVAAVAVDTQAPTIPANLIASTISTSQVNLSWNASTDNVAVSGYRVYRNGTQVGSPTSTSYPNTGLTVGTAYNYTVAAYDAAGNQSAQTAVTIGATLSNKFILNDRVQVTNGPINVRAAPSTSGTLLGTQATGNLGTVIGGPTYATGFYWWNVNYDTGVDGWTAETNLIKFSDNTAPVISSISTSNLTSSGVTITWATNENSDSQIEYGPTTSYGQLSTLNSSMVTSHSVTLSGLSAGAIYNYRIRSRDAAGNLGLSTNGTFTTLTSAPTGITYYVNGATGSDSAAGSQAAPFKTIQKAVGVVNPGDTVIVKDGTYTYNSTNWNILNISRSGTAAKWITIRSENKWGAKLDGQNNTATLYGVIISGSYVRFQDFDLSRVSKTAMDVSSTNHVDIIGNHIHDIGRRCIQDSLGITGIHGNSSTNVLVDGNRIHDVGRYSPGENGCSYTGGYTGYMNLDHGMYLDAVSSYVIQNNVFYNFFHGWAIQIYGNTSAGTVGMNIINNTFAFANPNRDGQLLLASPSVRDTNVQNNIFYSPRTSGVRLEGSPTVYSNVNISNNITYGGVITSGSPTGGVTIGTNFNNTDPKIVSSAGLDFHIQTTSPAKDAVVNTFGITTDFDRKTRPAGIKSDIGAYEF